MSEGWYRCELAGCRRHLFRAEDWFHTSPQEGFWTVSRCSKEWKNGVVVVGGGEFGLTLAAGGGAETRKVELRVDTAALPNMPEAQIEEI